MDEGERRATLQDKEMNERRVQETLFRFTIAAATLARHKSQTDVSKEQVSVIFMADSRNSMPKMHLDLARLASQEGKDIVHLEFQPGEEHAGPKRITIFEYKVSAVPIWENGVVWLSDDDRIGLIVHDEGNVCFSFDGTHLRRFEKNLARSELARGIERASVIMKQIADEVPDDLVSGGSGRNDIVDRSYH